VSKHKNRHIITTAALFDFYGTFSASGRSDITTVRLSARFPSMLQSPTDRRHFSSMNSLRHELPIVAI
jgi:hypothetical protein